MSEIRVSVPGRAMIIVAHPDDAEFSMAGTVALWAGAGCAVSYVICTRGDRGSNDPGEPPWVMAPIREREQRAAAAVLGVQEVNILPYDDGTLEPTLELRRDLTRHIRRFRPEIVMCNDPSMRFFGDSYLNHPDHRAAASAALDAVFPTSETRFIFPELLTEGLEPHRVRAVFITNTEPNVWIDIASVIAKKIAALRCHASQVDPDHAADWIRNMAARMGEGQGMAAAEAYRRIVINGD